MTPLVEQMQDVSSRFAREGYVTLPNVVSKSRLAALTEELRSEFHRVRTSGGLFSGGGSLVMRVAFPVATSIVQISC